MAMKHPRIDDEQILDRYLIGQLSAADEALFEEHLFECAECLESAQAGEDLRAGLRAVAAEDAARATATAIVTVGLAAWLRRLGPAGRVGVAALALIVAALPALVLWQQAELSQVRAVARQAAGGSGLLAPISDLDVVSLGVVRDGDVGEAPAFRVDPAKDAVVLSLELPAVDAARYGVTLYDDGGIVAWVGEGLVPNLYDTLLIVLPSAFLKPASYRIVIEAQTPTGRRAVGEIEFRVLSKSSSGT